MMEMGGCSLTGKSCFDSVPSGVVLELFFDDLTSLLYL